MAAPSAPAAAAAVATGAASAEAGPAWKRLLLASLAKQSNQKTASFVQIATVRADSRPANRTIVFRGFLEDSCRMLFYTDTRSAKVDEIAKKPWAEVCWYMPDSWEQFRIHGRAEVVDSSHESAELLQLRSSSWVGLSERQKNTWRGPHPGTPKHALEQGAPESGATESSGGAAQEKDDASGSGLEPLDCFCLLLLSPTQVDYLSIKEDLRSTHTLPVALPGEEASSWIEESVYP